jgi:hypothetical protein
MEKGAWPPFFVHELHEIFAMTTAGRVIKTVNKAFTQKKASAKASL